MRFDFFGGVLSITKNSAGFVPALKFFLNIAILTFRLTSMGRMGCNGIADSGLLVAGFYGLLQPARIGCFDTISCRKYTQWGGR